ncbi:MAG: glycoside hydrolase family 127 protein, partial [Bacteroidota bacterium]
KNTTEWVQYDFDSTYTVSESKVYWFDDGPWGGCRIPLAWKLYYKSGNEWIPVKNTSSYEIVKDKYNGVKFEPVTTTAMKLEVQLPLEYAAGVHEWKVK